MCVLVCVCVCAGVCMLVCVCECTGICMCVHCYVYVCARVHTGQNKVSSSFSSFILIPFFKRKVLLADLDLTPSLYREQDQDLPISGVAQVNAGDPSSGSHACTASILPTESCPQAQIKGLSAIKSSN